MQMREIHKRVLGLSENEMHFKSGRRLEN